MRVRARASVLMVNRSPSQSKIISPVGRRWQVNDAAVQETEKEKQSQVQLSSPGRTVEPNARLRSFQLTLEALTQIGQRDTQLQPSEWLVSMSQVTQQP